MKALSQINLECKVGQQSGKDLATGSGCCRTEFRGLSTLSDVLYCNVPFGSFPLVVKSVNNPSGRILKSDPATMGFSITNPPGTREKMLGTQETLTMGDKWTEKQIHLPKNKIIIGK